MPAGFRAGGNHIRMSCQNDQGRLGSSSQPQIADLPPIQRGSLETQRGQAEGNEFLTSAIFGSHRGMADQFRRQFQGGVGHSGAPQQFIDTGFGTGLGIHFLDDDGAV